MKARIGYLLLRMGLALLAYLPWWMIRGLAWGISFLLRRVIRYRYKVVRDNLARSFPSLSPTERDRILRDYYEHFVCQYLSTPKLLSLPIEEIRAKHLKLEGMEVFQELQQRGHQHFIVLMAHYGNWELFSAAQTYFSEFGIQQEQIYRPLSNEYVDRIFVDLRSRYGSKLIAKNDTGRRLVAVSRNPESPSTVFGFIADQTPGINALHYWTEFLHQPTPFLDGAERLARKLGLPILYMSIERTGTFSYTGRFEPLSEYPQQTAQYEPTELFVRRLEEAIQTAPSLWLWSHRRWKHSFAPTEHAYVSPRLREHLDHHDE